jgi:hypothetical protein
MNQLEVIHKQVRRPYAAGLAALAIWGLAATALVLAWRGPAQAPRAQAGAGYDYVQMTPLSSNPIGGGMAGVWSKTTTGRVQFTDASGGVLEAGEARKLYSSAGAPASPSAADIWYDSTAQAIGYRDSSGSRTLPQATNICTLSGNQAITGAKTVQADWSVTDNSYDLGDATHRWQQLGVIEVLSGTSSMKHTANVADGASAVGHILDNTGALTNATSRIASFKNAGVEKAAVRYDGALLTPSVGTSYSAQHVLPTGTGDLVSTDATQTLTNKTLTSPTINSATFGANTLVLDRIHGAIAGALGAATVYLGGIGVAAGSTEYPLSIVRRAGTVRTLYCYLATAPGGSDTAVFTVRKNASDQALTCTISASAQTCNDTSNTFTVVAGDRLSVKAVSSATTAAGAACTFEEGNT